MNYHFDYISRKLRSLIKPAVKQSHRFKSELSFKEYPNSYIAPFISWEESVGCALDSNGKDIDNLLSDCATDSKYYDIQTAETEHKTVIFLGYLIGVFGHAFIDNLRSLWFLDTDDCKRLLENGAELVYVTDHNKPLSDTYVKIFDMAGFDIRRARHIDRLIKFDNIIIPDSSIRSAEFGRTYCDSFCSVLDRVKARIPTSSGSPVYDKVYFTRSKYPNNREVGEEKIEYYFKKAGFTIISPELYSLEAQLQMVRSCSCFAATEGSIAHISLLCRPGTKVIIVNKANYLNIHQVMINELADLDVTYIEAHRSSATNQDYRWIGPFFLYPTKYLTKFFGEKPCTPFWLNSGYWHYYFGNNPKTRLLKKIYRSLTKKRMA